jgi:hypothetical protein
MAPRDEQFDRRGGIGDSHRNGNACTNAGVNRHRPPDARGARRARVPRHRPSHTESSRAPANAPTGPSLASRITYDRGRSGFHRGVRPRPRPQHGLRLQDRITRPDVTIGTGRNTQTTNLPVDHRAQGPHRIIAPADEPSSGSGTNLGTDTGVKYPPPIYAPVDNSNNLSQNSIFAGSQPTQVTGTPDPLSPPIWLAKPAQTARPIRMFNEPVAQEAVYAKGEGQPTTPKRPVYNYRGKDPIKRLVSNPKLQAVLAGKSIPPERKKHKDDRMDLRMGASKITK